MGTYYMHIFPTCGDQLNDPSWYGLEAIKKASGLNI